MKRYKAVLRKEFSHIFRDPVSLSIILVMPVLMVFIYGYAINYDLEEIRTGIIDFANSHHSAELIQAFGNNNTYRLINLQGARPLEKGEEMLKSGRLHQYLIVPADFPRKWEKNGAGMAAVVDGSDSNVANLVVQTNQRALADFIRQGRRNEGSGVKMKTGIYFNPRLQSAYFFVPGIIALILIMISAFLTAMSITREKEAGSIDLIFLSPLKSREIILGKTIPYLLIGLICETLILLFAHFWYQIPFRGSILIMLVFSILYLLSGLSIGVLIATVTTSQKAALFAVFLVTLLPTIMLSGFIFPLNSLGPVIRALSRVVPATYFLRIIRGIILKGAELRHFIPEGLALSGFSLLLMGFSMKRFSRVRNRRR